MRPILVLVVCVLGVSCRCASSGAGEVPDGEGCRADTIAASGVWAEVDVDGMTREFILDVPAAPAGRKLPVVLAFHGIGGDPETLREYTGIGAEAVARGYIAVLPRGEIVRLGARVGPGWSIASKGNREVRLVEALLRWLDGNYCVDGDRIHVAGFSNGAHLAHVLACRMPERIAAIGAVGGALREMAEGCGSSVPVAAIVIHGGADPVVGVEEGRSASEHWKRMAGCGEGAQMHGVCAGYDACRVPVTYCELPGLGHSWPRGDMGDALDASSALLDFFGVTGGA